METDLVAYLESVIPELSGKIYRIGTPVTDDLSLVLLFSPVSMDHVNQTQVTAIVTHQDYDTAYAMAGKVRQALGREIDEPWNIQGDTRFYSGVAGGGEIYNDGPGMYEITTYFIIYWRKI